MRRIISVIMLTAFTFTQAAAYAQQIAYPSTPHDTGMKEKAMIDAVFKAEYKQEDAEKREKRLKELKGPMRGKRERAIMEGAPARRAGRKPDLRRRGPAAEKELRRITDKRKIPKNADLGSGIAREVNEIIYPFKVSGDYQLAWGYDWGYDEEEGDRSIWKNADFKKANMVYVLDNQYVWGEDRENTYDKRVYDRFRLKLETTQDTGPNFLTEVVVDPWSFVGKTDAFMITDTEGQFPIQLRYWSNTGKTISERVWLSSGTDFINIPEIHVKDGKTVSTTIVSRWNQAEFELPTMEIERELRPIRKLEAGYRNEGIDFKVFALADHDHAFTTDDPLTISNRHIYWEPSPWLNRWKPALYYPSTMDFRKGKWSNDIAFEARDSDYNYLTLLRGLSFEFNHSGLYIGGGIATPLHLWQDYENVNALPGSVRIKQALFDNYYVGAIYAFDYGFSEFGADAHNHVVGLDAGYEIKDFLSLRGEVARSSDKLDVRAHDEHVSQAESSGNAFRVEAKSEFFKDGRKKAPLAVSSSFTHMQDDFMTRLSNYRNTRSDEYWGKHIYFHEVSPYFEEYKIGDGVDFGRNVIAFRMENSLLDEKFESLFDMRFVRGDLGAKIENVYREEITIMPLSNLTGKFLFRFQDLPKTTAGRDPYIIEDYISDDSTGRYITNDDIVGGEDADVYTISLGVHYDPVKWLGLEEIYEYTNDYDKFPSMVFNDAGFRIVDGDIRALDHYLYSQPLIAIPPYDDYSIFKTRLFWTPFDTVRTKFEYVINTNKQATGRDDNISHWGFELDMDFTQKLHGSFKFTRSQLIDLFRQQSDGIDVPFHRHNNIFAKLEFNFWEDHSIIAQFGEYFVPAAHTPIQWFLNTVETQRIVRLYLKGKF